MITILMTGAGAPGMPGILHCLRYANDSRFRLVGADMNSLAACRHQFEVFYTIPSANDNNFVDELLEICRKEKVDLVLSCVTRELNVLAKNKRRFETIGVKVAVMDYEQLVTVNNKGNLLTELKNHGFVTPEFYIAETWAEVERYAKLLGHPQHNFCIKGVVGNGSRAIRTIVSYKEMAQKFFEEKPNGMVCSYEDIKGVLQATHPWPCKMMVMEELPGYEFSVDVLANNGNILSIIGRRSIVVRSSNPMQCLIEKNNYIEDYCTQVVSKLKLSGNIGFDFKADSHGIPQLLEINPRLTGAIVACCAAGVNLPYLGILNWLGEEFEIPKVHYGIRMVRRLEELFFDENDTLITF